MKKPSTSTSKQGRRGLLLALLLVAVLGAAAFVRLPTPPAARIARSPVGVATSGHWASLQSTSSSLHATKRRRHWWGQQQARPGRAVLQAAAAAGGNNDLKEKLLVTIRSLYFPLSVLGAGLLGAWKPAVYAGLSEGFVTRALAAVMVLMGATLTLDDFKRIGKSRKAVLLGWCAQFSIMPSMALLMSRLYRLPPHLAAGVVLVGCCPGGTASNLVTLLAEADVALSVTMTAVSTVTAGVMTPLLTSLILGALVPVDTRALVVTTLQVVLLPVILGLLTNTYVLPKLSPTVTRQLNAATPVLSGLLVAAICGKVVSANAAAVAQAGLPLLLSVISLHIFGFLFGFIVARVLGFSRKVAKTVSIETGMQNSALAVVLARNSLPHPLSGLPGCVSAVCHSVIGSILAFVWSRESPAKREEH